MIVNDFVFWFSIIVTSLVIIWAVLMIRAYNRVERKD